MIFAFEEIGPTLDLVPLAARRALDAAGCKVSLEAWRALAVDARRALVLAGAAERVDAKDVRARLKRERVPFARIDAVADPPAKKTPAAVVRALGHDVADATWRALSPLERYALVKLAGRSRSDRLERAHNEIVLVPEPLGPHAPVSTHVNRRGEVHMVDVGGKVRTLRRAVAQAKVTMLPETIARLQNGGSAKGDVLATARVAGIQAAKRTPELIPLCHAIALTRVEIDLTLEEGGVAIKASAEAEDRTGVEMEAMVAASTAALTVYDMLKGVDRGMRFHVELLEKSGGRSGTWTRSPRVGDSKR
jgi:cyclic pyranopterin phosphate synthase